MKSFIALFVIGLVWATSVIAGPVQIQYITAQRILSETRTVYKVDLDVNMAQMFERTHDYIISLGYSPIGAAFSRVLSEGVSTLTVQAGFPVAVNFPNVSGVYRTGYLPSGRVATTIHVGSYETLPTAYYDIESYMDYYGYYSVGSPWESYIDDASEVPEEEVRTQIVWPVSSIAP